MLSPLMTRALYRNKYQITEKHHLLGKGVEKLSFKFTLCRYKGEMK